MPFHKLYLGNGLPKQAIGQESDTVVDRILTGLSFKFSIFLQQLLLFVRYLTDLNRFCSNHRHNYDILGFISPIIKESENLRITLQQQFKTNLEIQTYHLILTTHALIKCFSGIRIQALLSVIFRRGREKLIFLQKKRGYVRAKSHTPFQ